MNKEQKNCLQEAMMFLEIAFFGGNDDWKKDEMFADLDESEMASFAHGLIQFAESGYKNDDYILAKSLSALISSRMIIEDAMRK